MAADKDFKPALFKSAKHGLTFAMKNLHNHEINLYSNSVFDLQKRHL